MGGESEALVDYIQDQRQLITRELRAIHLSAGLTGLGVSITTLLSNVLKS